MTSEKLANSAGGIVRGVMVGRQAAGKRLTNLFSIGVPMAGACFAIYWLSLHPPTSFQLILAGLFYAATGIGIGVGFHRCFTHQAFRPSRMAKLTLATLGSLAFQGSLIRWVADHRRHHRYTDDGGDVHSPVVSYDCIEFDSKATGLFYAHIGWMFDSSTTDYTVYAPDLLKDSTALLFHRLYWPLCMASLLVPALLCYLVEGGWVSVVNGFLLAGCVRTFALHNFIWAINSIGHTYGSQEASQHDSSRNNLLLAFLTFGEGWHNNHHARPRSAFNDWKWYQFDFNGWVIRAMAKCGLASDVVPPKRSIVREDAIRW